MSWKDGLLIAAAVVGGLWGYSYLSRRQVMAGPLGDDRGTREMGIKRALLGAKAVAEAGKAAARGADAYASEKEAKQVRKV